MQSREVTRACECLRRFLTVYRQGIGKEIMQLFRNIRKHPLLDLLITSKDNSKALILMEPLWGIPFHLLAPFATLYMFKQGITEVQIGLLISISMMGQLIFSLFSGVITDKLGRLVSTAVGEITGWSLAAFVWAISNNFWLFLLAVLFHSSSRIPINSWQCLLIEDAKQKDLLGIFTWVHIGGLVAVFFAPISGLLIDRYTLIPVVRGLYLFFGINTVIKGILTYKCCVETKQGEIRKEETKALSIRILMQEYKGVIPRIVRSPAILKIVAISSLLHVAMMVNGTFFGLYVTTKLGVEERFLAFFPIINAMVMMIFMFVIQHRIAYIKMRIPLWIGLVIFAICHTSLILFPPNLLYLIIINLFFVAVASALVMPRTEAMMQLALEPQERARILAIIMSFTIAFAAPFGFVAGFLSSIDRRLPFVLTTILFVIALVIVCCIKDNEFKATKSTEV